MKTAMEASRRKTASTHICACREKPTGPTTRRKSTLRRTPLFVSLFFLALCMSWDGAAGDIVRIAMPETESGSSSVPAAEESFKLLPTKALQSSSPEPAKHHLDLTIQKIVSRLTSQEMDEVNMHDSVVNSVPKVSPNSKHSAFQSPTTRTRDPALATRIVTIPMSAVPPRLQKPGSSKGMPPRMRIVEIDRSQRSPLSNIFRRGLHGSGKEEPKVSKKTVTVDLHGGIIGVGEYYSIIELGKKKIRVQVDTGSSTLAGKTYPTLTIANISCSFLPRVETRRSSLKC